MNYNQTDLYTEMENQSNLRVLTYDGQQVSAPYFTQKSYSFYPKTQKRADLTLFRKKERKSNLHSGFGLVDLCSFLVWSILSVLRALSCNDTCELTLFIVCRDCVLGRLSSSAITLGHLFTISADYKQPIVSQH